MILHIPVWLLWTVGLALGIPAMVIVIFFAYLGFALASSLRPPRW
jgi:hypothetical protein